MRVFVSTLGTPIRKAGELLSLDGETKRVLKRAPVVAIYPQVHRQV